MKKSVFLLNLFIAFPLFANGNAEVGEEKSIVCAACHGQKGISPSPIWPNLAGQHSSYTIQQLQDYKDGKERNDPSMTTIAAALSTEEMADLAAYYKQQPVAEGAASKETLKRGEILYRGGDINKGITACIACHGPKGSGNSEAKFPVVSGQHARYTIEQLQAFKEGKRKNDLNGIMRDIASRMSKEDMEAVANYIQGLH